MNYVVGTSLLHRLGAGNKLAAVAMLSLVVATRPPLSSLAVLGAAFAAFSLLAAPFQVAARCWRIGLILAGPMMLILMISLLATHWKVDTELIQRSLFASVHSGLSLLIPVVAALLLSATTSSTSMMTTLHGFASRIVGEQAAWRASCAVLLCFRTIPLARETYLQIQDAFRARGIRGIRGRPWKIFVPFLIALVDHALQTGVALDARRVLH